MADLASRCGFDLGLRDYPLFHEMTLLRPSDMAKRAVRLAEQFTPRIFSAIYCKSAIRLHIYNFLHQYPDATDSAILASIRKLSHMIEAEQMAYDDRCLPTIGLEIEVSTEHLTVFLGDRDNNLLTQIAQDLEYMGIHPEYINAGLSEIKLPPSTSALTQWHMLAELIKLGLVPRNGEDDEDEFASLHINIGIPQSVDLHTINFALAGALSDLLTYAFVPPFRVAERVGFIKGDVCIDEYEGIDIKRNGWARIHHKLEFRTPCVVGAKTARLLCETQKLAALVFNDHSCLKKLQDQFEYDVVRLRSKYQVEQRLPQRHPKLAATIIKYAYYLKLIDHPDFCDEIGVALLQTIKKDSSFSIKVIEDVERRINQRLVGCKRPAAHYFSFRPDRGRGKQSRWLSTDTLLRRSNIIDDARAIMTFYARQIAYASSPSGTAQRIA